MFKDPSFYVTVICTLALVAYVQRIVLVVLAKLEQLRAQLAVYDGEQTKRTQATTQGNELRHERVIAQLDRLERVRRFGVVLVVGAYRDASRELVQFIAGARVPLGDQWTKNEALTGEVEIGPVQFNLEPGTIVLGLGPCVLEGVAVGIDLIGPWANRNETPIAVVGRPITVGTTIRVRVRELPW
jgi:hypothetical protein